MTERQREWGEYCGHCAWYITHKGHKCCSLTKERTERKAWCKKYLTVNWDWA